MATTGSGAIGPRLGWVDECLPADDVRERHRLANRLELGLEVVFRGGDRFEPERYRDAELLTLQAWGMHHWHPTARYRDDRQQAVRHVEEALETADRLGVGRVLTIACYGHELADSPFERALDFFDRVGRRARALGRRIVVEPLSSRRAAAFVEPQEVEAVLGELDQDDVFGLCLDTGHLLDQGHDEGRDCTPGRLLEAVTLPVEELQLRGADSRPPLDLSLDAWLVLDPPPQLLVGEHREPIEVAELERVIASWRELLD